MSQNIYGMARSHCALLHKWEWGYNRNFSQAKWWRCGHMDVVLMTLREQRNHPQYISATISVSHNNEGFLNAAWLHNEAKKILAKNNICTYKQYATVTINLLVGQKRGDMMWCKQLPATKKTFGTASNAQYGHAWKDNSSKTGIN